MQTQSNINCPNCGSTIDVQDILTHQLEEEISKKYQQEISLEKKRIQGLQEVIQKEKREFEEKKRQENELFQERLDKQLKEAKQELESKLKSKVEEEQIEKFKILEKEISEKSEQIKELHRTKAEIEQLKREKSELKEAAMVEAERNLTQKLNEEREKIQKAESERNELKFKELEKQLEAQKQLTKEMQRKQEQGSMQLQGEVQELAIEEWLSSKYPLDGIEEIGKGQRGGDCIQIVNTLTDQNCGTIYYESKRTKEFHVSWIEKFKADMRVKGADMGVLVTAAMPKDMERMGMKDGIWICTYEEFKGLSGALRQSIIKVSQAMSSQENKGDKMHMLYDFLTSNTFKMQIEAIVEGFTTMKNDLDSEKRAMMRIWKQREMQLEKVLINTGDMYGSIKGVAGNAIPAIKSLELPE